MSNGLKIAWRLVVILICAVFLAAAVSVTIEEVADWLDSRNWGRDLEGYDLYLYQGEYMDLRDRLDYYRPEGEAFEIYRDVADAYESWSVYEFWELAGDEGLDTGGYGQEYLEDLLRIYEQSGMEAQKLINGFAGEVLQEFPAAGSR